MIGLQAVVRAADRLKAEADEPATEKGELAKVLPQEERGRSILVIDDDSDARDLMERSLTKHGFTVVTAAGRRIVNVDPAPTVLSTVTSPPIMRQNRRVMARPRPVPPNWRVVEASAWVNPSKSLASLSGGTPITVPGHPKQTQ